MNEDGVMKDALISSILCISMDLSFAKLIFILVSAMGMLLMTIVDELSFLFELNHLFILESFFFANGNLRPKIIAFHIAFIFLHKRIMSKYGINQQ